MAPPRGGSILSMVSRSSQSEQLDKESLFAHHVSQRVSVQNGKIGFLRFL